MENKKINILGTEYSIKFSDEKEYPGLIDNDGYTDTSVKLIVVDNFKSTENDPTRKADVLAYQKQVLRREIIHAFLAESGLDGNGRAVDHWEFNEEMVDWFAIQYPKIYKVFVELDIL